MSEGQTFFMRVRGRVLGPFDQEKLQGLSRRGQLSRMHEVSIDGVAWVRASTFPELFVVAIVETPGLDNLAATFGAPAASVGAQGFSPVATPTAGKQDWFYTSGGREQGPVDFASLQVLAGTGQLGPQDLVWTNGMAAWTPAAQVTGLTRTDGGQGGIDSHSHATREKEKDEELSARVRIAAQSSRPWVLFLVIVGFIFAVLNIIGGVLLLVLGAKMGPLGGGLIFSGLMGFVQSAITATGAVLLMNYANHLGSLVSSKLPAALEKAMNSLRTYWMFVSIVLIVALAFVAVSSILVFSSVVSLPRVNFG